MRSFTQAAAALPAATLPQPGSRPAAACEATRNGLPVRTQRAPRRCASATALITCTVSGSSGSQQYNDNSIYKAGPPRAHGTERLVGGARRPPTRLVLPTPDHSRVSKASCLRGPSSCTQCTVDGRCPCTPDTAAAGRPRMARRACRAPRRRRTACTLRPNTSDTCVASAQGRMAKRPASGRGLSSACAASPSATHPQPSAAAVVAQEWPGAVARCSACEMSARVSLVQHRSPETPQRRWPGAGPAS